MGTRYWEVLYRLYTRYGRSTRYGLYINTESYYSYKTGPPVTFVGHIIAWVHRRRPSPEIDIFLQSTLRVFPPGAHVPMTMPGFMWLCPHVHHAYKCVGWSMRLYILFRSDSAELVVWNADCDGFRLLRLHVA